MISPSDCRPGVRVECIDGQPHGGLRSIGVIYPLKVGNIYTIVLYNERLGEIMLEEISPNFSDIFWALTRFRLPRDLREVFREAFQPIKENEHV